MKKVEEKVVQSINVSPEKSWEVISKGSGVDKWFSSLIKSCRLEGDKRFCETVDGIELEEQIHEVNHNTKTFRFSITRQNLLPVENISETIRVIGDGPDKSIIEWAVEFESEDENTDEYKNAFKKLFTSGLTELENYVNN